MIFIAFLSVIILLSFSTDAARHPRSTLTEKFCRTLFPEELKLFVKQGKCADITFNSTTVVPPTTPSTEVRNFFERNAKKVLENVYISKPHVQEIKLTHDPNDVVLLEGTFAILNCSVEEKENITWFFNNRQIDEDILGWRLEIVGTQLHIRPLIAASDSGRFQCLQDDILMGAVHLEILTTSEALWIGFINYLIAMGAAAPVILIAICVNSRAKDPEEHKTKKVDPVTEFYEEQLHITADKMKKNLRKSADADRKALEHPAAVEKLSTIHVLPTLAVKAGQRTNMDTVMTMIAMGERRDAMNNIA